MTDRHLQVAIIGGGIVGTFLANQLCRRGIRVAIIEKGPRALSAQRPASPTILCTARPHDGIVAARNHVLGGNGYFWGGGLVRPASARLGDVLGLPESGSDKNSTKNH